MLRRHAFALAAAGLALIALPVAGLAVLELVGSGGDLNAWLEGGLGLTHQSPLPAAAVVLLLAAPVVVLLLYFLRLKRRPVSVSSTFLWKKSVEDLHVNRLFQWLRRNVLLLLQLLAAFALLYAVLAPRLHGRPSAGKHYVLVIDNSASMSATDVPPSRLEWAKAEAVKEIDAASDADRGMVIVFNSAAEIRQSYTADRDQLRRAVRDIAPTNRPTRFEEALALAGSLANPGRSTEDESVRPENPEPGKERTYAAAEGMAAEVHLFSDGRFADVPDFALANLRMTFHAPENAGTDNVGVVGLGAIRDPDDPGKVQAFATVANYRREPTRVTLKLDVLDADGNLRDARTESVNIEARKVVEPAEGEPGRDEPAERKVAFRLTGVDDPAGNVVRVRLDGQDSFAADDEAFLVLGVARQGRVLIVTSGNPLLSLFFEAPKVRRLAEVTTIAPAQLADADKYRKPALDGAYDLVVFDRCAPAAEDEMPRRNTLFLGRPPPKAGTPYETEVVTGPLVRGYSDKHPVMRGLRGWHELEIAEAVRIKGLPPKAPRLLEGDADLILMTALARQSFTDVVVAFPLTDADGRLNTRWFMRVQYPLFLRNVLYALGGVRDAGAEEPVSPGGVVSVRPGAGVREIRVRRPSGASDAVKQGAAGRGGRRDGGTGRVRGVVGGRRAAVRGQPVRPRRGEHRAAVERPHRGGGGEGGGRPEAAARAVALGRAGRLRRRPDRVAGLRPAGPRMTRRGGRDLDFFHFRHTPGT